MKIAHAPTASAVNQHPIDENQDARMSMTEKRARISGHDTAAVLKRPVTNHPTSALGTPSLYPLSCKYDGIESMELRASPQQKMGTMAMRNNTAESSGHAVWLVPHAATVMNMPTDVKRASDIIRAMSPLIELVFISPLRLNFL